MRSDRFRRYPTYASPFALMHVVMNGQSLSVGYGSTDSGEPTQLFRNKKLYDSSGNYTIASPNAGTLSAVPLTTPIRPANMGSSTAVYPGNIGANAGSTADVAMCNMLSKLLGWSFLSSNTGRGAASIDDIKKGGTGNAYSAGIYEAQAFAPVSGANPSGGNLAAAAGFSSFGPACVPFLHGETDSLLYANQGITPATVYQGDLVTMQGNYETDLGAMAPARPVWLPHVPMILSQPNGSPPSFSGRSIVRDAMTNLATGSPLLFINAGPKYQIPPNGAFGPYHKYDYRPLGEKYAQFYAKYVLEQIYAYLLGRAVNPNAWAPLQITSVSISGTTVTVTVYNPSNTPLVLDTTTVTKPHQSVLTFWSGGFGFEAWENQVLINGVSQTTPVRVTTASAHNQLERNPYIIVGTNASANAGTNANGQFYVHVVDSTHLDLYSDAGLTSPIPAASQPYVGPNTGLGYCPVGVTNATILSNTTIQLTLARALATGNGYIAYAEHSDAVASESNGALPERCGNVRDSDNFYYASLILNSLSGGFLPAHWSNWLNGSVWGPM